MQTKIFTIYSSVQHLISELLSDIYNYDHNFCESEDCSVELTRNYNHWTFNENNLADKSKNKSNLCFFYQIHIFCVQPLYTYIENEKIASIALCLHLQIQYAGTLLMTKLIHRDKILQRRQLLCHTVTRYLKFINKKKG